MFMSYFQYKFKQINMKKKLFPNNVKLKLVKLIFNYYKNKENIKESKIFVHTFLPKRCGSQLNPLLFWWNFSFEALSK